MSELFLWQEKIQAREPLWTNFYVMSSIQPTFVQGPLLPSVITVVLKAEVRATARYSWNVEKGKKKRFGINPLEFFHRPEAHIEAHTIVHETMTPDLQLESFKVRGKVFFTEIWAIDRPHASNDQVFSSKQSRDVCRSPLEVACVCRVSIPSKLEIKLLPTALWNEVY